MRFSDDDLKRYEKRFLDKTKPAPEADSDCLLWIGAKTGSGYGQMQFYKRREMAHRIAFMLWNGPIKNGNTIDHLCQRKLCVFPLHLQQIPMLDNCRLGSKAQNTNCPKGHPFEGRNVIWIGTSRMCRTCKQDKDRRYHWKNRERINARKRESWRKAAGK